MSYGYQWLDCDSTGGACAAISGATGTSHVLTSADVGHTVSVAVTAKNSAGQATAAAAATAAVQATPAATPQPSFPIYAAFYYPWSCLSG